MKKLILIIVAGVILLTAVIYLSVKAYHVFYRHNVNAEEQGYVLFIPTGSSYHDVIRILTRDTVLKNICEFEWLAEKMKYPENVHPGRFILKHAMTHRDIIRKLRAGNQDAVKVFFKKYRTKPDLVSFITKKLEVDSVELITILNDSVFLMKYSLKPENSKAVFLADSYEFYWNTNAQQLFDRMMREYEKFWTNARIEKAMERGLTPLEVITLASIVEEETIVDAEKPRIAGVYLNRLKKDMKLQADPTVKFALQDFTLRRILNRHLQFQSTYNTYVTKGLPPGPICIPSKQSIEAVLNSEDHQYIFFCADVNGAGTHLFAETYKQHQANARQYRRMLNTNKIF